jgi:hypothetical protein
MFSRLINTLKHQNYSVLLLEVLVVIFSILVAFELDRWADDKRDRKQERNYLQRLSEDMQIEIGQMDDALDYADSRITAARLLADAVSAKGEAENDPALAWALETASWRSYPTLPAFVYSELLNSGNLALIESERLRRTLAEHYANLNHYARVGTDRDVQIHFDRATAGILSAEELTGVEQSSWQNKGYAVSASRALEIAAELKDRPRAVALVPSIIQHHEFNKRVIRQARTSAQGIIEQIEDLQK